MKPKAKFFYLLSILLIGLTACQASQPLAQTKEPTSVPLPTPMAGKAVMTGQILNVNDDSPYSNIAVRLAQVFRQGEEGAFALDLAHSPGNFSEANGVFVIDNISPGEYLIVVGEPDQNNYVIVQDKDNKPVTFQVEAGMTVEAGTYKLDFTP